MQGSKNEVYSVLSGFPVTYSSIYPHADCQIFRLGADSYAWSPKTNDQNQWIQVSSIKPQTWIAVVLQGHSNYDQRVLEYQVSYSMNGIDWTFVDNGRKFKGCRDRIEKVRNNFEKSVVARVIRIHPTRWEKHISLRFDAIFVQS